MTLRIRTQAYVVSALPLFFLLVLLALALVVQNITLQGAAVAQRTALATRYLDETRDTINLASRAVGAYGRNRRSVDIIKRLGALRATLNVQLAGLKFASARARNLSDAAASVGALDESALDILEQYSRALQTGDTAELRRIESAPSTASLAVRIAAANDRFGNVQRAADLAQINGLRKLIRTYETYLIAVCIAGILLTIFVSGRFGVSLARRIGRLARNARRVAAGEPVEPIGGDDEFADLDRVYQALMRRIAREHRISSALQRAMLPQALPQIDGLRIDAAYVAAADEAEVGGDWYDVFALSPDRLCVTIGDVGGHGLRAATVMANARIVMRTAARINDDPAAILCEVNRALCEEPGETLASALAAVLDLQTATLRYASAGHPDLMLMTPDASVEMLRCRGLLLGIDPGATYAPCAIELAQGSSVLFYTDGLVEQGRDYSQGVERLRSSFLEERDSNAENIAEAIESRVRDGGTLRDDAAVLLLRLDRLSRDGA